MLIDWFGKVVCFGSSFENCFDSEKLMDEE